MPKMKTNSSAKKKFKITGSGKIMRRKQGKNHILTKKSTKRKKRLSIDAEVHPAMLPKVKKMLCKA